MSLLLLGVANKDQREKIAIRTPIITLLHKAVLNASNPKTQGEIKTQTPRINWIQAIHFGIFF